MSDFRQHLEEHLKNPDFAQEWDKLELRYVVVKQIIKLRNSYDLTHK